MHMTRETRSSSAVALLGIPYDANSSYLRGPALAPKLIREALFSDSTNMWTEDGVDLGLPNTFLDQGDLKLSDEAVAAFAEIEYGVKTALSAGHPLISLGGDHSITYPTLRAFHSRYPDLTLLHFDAHPDLYDVLEGNRLSHACPFARIMEEGLVGRLVQIGIRTLNRHQFDQAQKFGVEVITMRNLAAVATLKIDGPLFISLDLDVLDPAFAPGISHYEPGGMSVREVLNCIQGLRAKIVGADIVEYNPTRDRDNQTAMVCSKFLKEIAAAMFREGRPPAENWR
jgi:agmatinase